MVHTTLAMDAQIMIRFTQSHQEQIARTGFLSCLVSYLFFWSLDLWRPGFVARYFSVHIFFLGIIVFGIWWAHVVEKYVDHKKLQWTIAIFCGMILCIAIFQFGTVFGSGRGVAALLALCIPILVLRLVRYK